MARSLRSARVANMIYYVLCGTLMGTWLVRIPAIEDRSGVDHATLGSLLVLLGLGAFFGMQVAGRIADRIGVRKVLPVGAVLASVTVVLPGLAVDAWTLAGALFVFGFCHGCLDVSMNAHAVHVEKAYEKPIMSSFHAMFSIGGVLAAIIGAGTANLSENPVWSMAAVGTVTAIIGIVMARWLLPVELQKTTVDAGLSESADSASSERKRRGMRRVWILAVLAFLVMLSEGAANDWSALHVIDILGASAGVAAFAYGTYAAAMTIGRFSADFVVRRFGSMAVLRWGASIAALGAAVAAFAPEVWVAYLGWGLFGLGLSGCVPQFFSAAGRVDPSAAGTNVSRVAGLGYLGMLAGPAVIGWMTHIMPLNYTLLLLTVLCLIAALSARVLREEKPTASSNASPSTQPEPQSQPEPQTQRDAQPPAQPEPQTQPEPQPQPSDC